MLSLYIYIYIYRFHIHVNLASLSLHLYTVYACRHAGSQNITCIQFTTCICILFSYWTVIIHLYWFVCTHACMYVDHRCMSLIYFFQQLIACSCICQKSVDSTVTVATKIMVRNNNCASYTSRTNKIPINRNK